MQIIETKLSVGHAEDVQKNVKRFARGKQLYFAEHEVTESLTVFTAIKPSDGVTRMFGVEGDVRVIQDIKFDGDEELVEDMLEYGFEQIQDKIHEHYLGPEMDEAFEKFLTK